MENKGKDRAYLLVSVFCLSICLLLVFCMMTRSPVMVGGEADGHLPPRQRELSEVENAKSEQKCMMITEEYFSKMLSQYLPAGFPAKKIAVDISKSGSISLSAQVERKNIEQYLEEHQVSLNMKQRLLVSMMPKTFDFSVDFACTTGEDGGTLLIVPEKIALNQSEIEVGELPAALLDEIGTAANSLLLGTGYYFTQIQFTDGAIELSAGEA